MSSLRQRLRTSLILGLSALLATAILPGCGENGVEQVNNEENDNRPPRRPRDNDAEWKVESLPFGSDAGFRLRLATDHNGTLGMAFFEIEPRIGEACHEIEVDDPPNKVLWSLHFAERRADEEWTTELIHEAPFVSAPQGLDLAYDHQGRAVVATMTGEPVAVIRYCGVNDLGVIWRDEPGQWRQETAVALSGEAATGEVASDYGYVVGYWPALAMDSDGQPGVAYRDVHAGGIQADDFRRADLEFVHRNNGGWTAEAVDWGMGAGAYNRMIFRDDDEPVIAYYTPQESRVEERLGYWVTWRDDGQWKRVHLFNQGNSEEPALLLDDQGALYFVFYDSEFGSPKVASLEDWDDFESPSRWHFEEIGSRTYDEGYSPSAAFSPGGNLAVAHYRCTRASEGLGNCSQRYSALIFTFYDGSEWVSEEVDSGSDLEFCGQAPTLVFDGDEPVIAYRCEVYDEESQTVSTEVRIARRGAID